LALVWALLAGSFIDEETVAAGAGKSDIVEIGSNDTSCALNGISCHTSGAE
jgi:hypothetical protein